MAAAGGLTPDERQQLAGWCWLITMCQDLDVFSQLRAVRDEYRYLLNADITVEVAKSCFCGHSLSKGGTGGDSIWLKDIVSIGKCSHADVDTVLFSLRLIHLAIRFKKSKATHFLLSLDKDAVNSKMGASETPLLMAIEDKNRQLVKELLAYGADVNIASRNSTPLITSICHGRSIFELLMSNPLCDVDLADGEGRTPLDMATVRGELWMMGRLIQAGAELKTVKEAGAGFTSSMAAVIKSAPMDVIQFLLRFGANWDKNSALTQAVKHGNINIVKLLISLQADVSATDSYGFTPINMAVKFGKRDCVKVLLDAGADARIPSVDGSTPLHVASCRGWLETVKVLVAAGTDPNLRTKLGASPLWHAVYSGHVDVVRYLVMLNVDLEVSSVISTLEAPCSTHDSPLSLAVGKAFPNIVDILLEAGYDIWREHWLVTRNYRLVGIASENEAAMRLISRLTSLCCIPPSLMHRCKMVLRKMIRTRLQEVLMQLKLPNPIKEYLLKTEL